MNAATTRSAGRTSGRVSGVVSGVEFLAIGAGDPITVFAHGLGGSMSQLRPLARDVGGTKVFLNFRGHGGSDGIPQGWDYDTLSADLLGVADVVGATQAVGVSMGAGALLRLLALKPDRFDRVAFVMPAALTEQRADGAIARLQIIAEAALAGDEARITELMLDEVPLELRSERAGQLLAARRARAIANNIPPFSSGEDVRPLHDLAQLRDMTAPALVLAQRGDPLHPSELAEILHDGLPHSELVLLAPGGIYWTDHQSAKNALATHLNMNTGVLT